MAPSVTEWAHRAFPELRADRPYHQLDDDSRPCPDSDISIRHCAHQGGSISPLMIFTTCDASANSVAAIAKVTLTRLSR